MCLSFSFRSESEGFDPSVNFYDFIGISLPFSL